jgi:hypothetical protein
MSSRPRRRPRLGAAALVLQAALLQAVLLVVPAHAQSQSDAGARRPAAAAPKEPPPPAEEPPAEHAPLEGVSTLKRLPKNAQLSESVRARLERRSAAARHAANLPQDDSARAATAQAPSQIGSAVALDPAAPSNEPLRRGEARQRRVQALDTGEGLTVLSNRLVLPEPRLALTAQRSAEVASELEPPVEAPDEPALAEGSSVTEPQSITETHSLRALSGRPTKSRATSAGLGWLVWPFALLLLGGAVVGTLWFRKKTE